MPDSMNIFYFILITTQESEYHYSYIKDEGLPRWSSGKDSALQGRARGFDPWSGD